MTATETTSAPEPAPVHPPPVPHLSPRTVWTMAVACGVSVANLYYIQPLLAEVGRAMAVDARRMGAVAAATQIGVAAGMFLFVPLGDMIERRRLIVGMSLAAAGATAAMALAPGAGWLTAVSLLIGLVSVVPHLVLPLAARLAAPAERGRIVGRLLAGLLIGVLLARTVSGLIADALGWRAVYLFATAAMLLLAAALHRLLPRSPPSASLTYPQLVRSLLRLVRQQPALVEAALTGAMLFGAFSVFWSTLAFHLAAPPHGYGSRVAGLFGLVGVIGAAIAPVAGRLSDRESPRLTVGIGIVTAGAGFAVFWACGASLWGLAAGVILLDLGVQAGHVANQTRIYALVADAGSRLNTVYMVSYFLGGALGSALGAYGWSAAGWPGVCLAGLGMLAMALAVHLWRAPARRSGTAKR
jgi:predicted MFS family arabinose efflux permease